MNRNFAYMALTQLMIAYANGERNHGSMNWEEVDIAFDYAKEALPGEYEDIKAELAKHEE